MTPVFLDTVGLIAAWNRDDQWHDAASRVFDRLKVARTPVVTTTYVLAGCGNAAARAAFWVEVDILRERLEQAGKPIVPTE